MSEKLTVELSGDQREVLLRGLRFVRSSLMLDVYDPTPELVEKRNSQLREVAALAEHLTNAPVVEAAG